MKIENAEIIWLESGLPYSTLFEDIYYSRDDELAESRHVFLEANGLRQRWVRDSNDKAFHLGELGFGSGLNFLQVMKLWEELEERPSRLHYIAFEKHPIRIAELKRLHQRWPSLARQSDELLEQYTDHAQGCHRIPLTNGITLDLYYGDAFEQLGQRMLDNCPAIQCWFLDGFSPANNAALWAEPLMQLLARCSDETTTLSTYSVAGKVRGALRSAGFEVNKIEGFGRKRHSLFATMPRSSAAQDPAPLRSKNPWFTTPRPHFKRNSAIVVGAGLAGCSTAHSLARRGWKVRLVDAGSEAASGASGNSQLALRCRLFNAPSPEAEFFLHAYLFALRQFSQMRRHTTLSWKPCGVLQLANAMNKRNALRQEKLAALYSEQVAQLLSKAEASIEAGIALAEEALHFPLGGAMAPSSLCASYLSHANIRCDFDTQVSEIVRSNGVWQVHTASQPALEADVVVIANSKGAEQFSQCAELPLQALRGQTSEVPSNRSSSELKMIVSGGRTVFPALADRHFLSASYANSDDLSPQSADSSENLRIAARNFVDSDILNKESVLERVSLRCNTPDRMPLVGMAPNLEKMRSTYAELSKNARARIDSTGEYYAGLYLNLAHGSNGLASCPLSAEYLASLIEGENIPISMQMAASLNPTRFLIQDLKKQR